MHTRPMPRLLIRTDGTITDLPPEAIGNTDVICYLIGATTLDAVTLKHLGLRPKIVMLVDDAGMVDHRPPNAEATRLYHLNCIPGTFHPICGDVVVCPDSDFAL